MAVEEIKVGDNDNLAALVAHLIDADLLVLLTDVDGLYTGDPRRDPAARRLDTVEAITDDIQRLVCDAAGAVSVGGMATKLRGRAEGGRLRDPHGHRRAAASAGVLARLLQGRAGRAPTSSRATDRLARPQALDRLRGAAPGPAHG